MNGEPGVRRIGRLEWLWLTIPPVAFLFTLGAQYLVGTLPCDSLNRWRWMMFLIPVIPLLTCGVIAMRAMAHDASQGGRASGAPSRIDQAIVLVAVVSAVAIVAQWLPALILPCR